LRGIYDELLTVDEFLFEGLKDDRARGGAWLWYRSDRVSKGAASESCWRGGGEMVEVDYSIVVEIEI
jgi:hypothetical protein